MKQIIAFAAVLILVPVIVLSFQLRNAKDGVGGPSDYLEIERPLEVEIDDPLLERNGIPVLCYHYLTPRPGPMHLLRVIGAVVFNLPTLEERHFWSSPINVFESHMRWLKDNGYEAISAEDLVLIMEGHMDAPEKAVCITFDDGERSLLDLGLPVLEKYGMKATLFLVTAQVGKNWRGLEMMSWAELNELESSGLVSVQSHTHDMHYKVKTENGGMEPVQRFWAPDGETSENSHRVLGDLMRSRAEISRHLGHDADLLAWPYGFGNHRLDAVARRAGFRATFSLLAGAVQTNTERPWHIRRFTVTARTTVALLKEMVEGDSTEQVSYEASSY